MSIGRVHCNGLSCFKQTIEPTPHRAALKVKPRRFRAALKVKPRWFRAAGQHRSRIRTPPSRVHDLISTSIVLIFFVIIFFDIHCSACSGGSLPLLLGRFCIDSVLCVIVIIA